MGLPIPFLFFWQYPKTGELEIVDGSQRLRTLEDFLLGDFVLGELEQLSLLSGFRFKDLPLARQRKIMNRSIRGIVLSEHADAQSRFDLFERINTGSKNANSAELRRGAHGGPFLELVILLGKDPIFEKLTPLSDKRRLEREREELVTRFFAYGDGLDDYKDSVAQFIFAYTKKMNDRFQEFPLDAETYKKNFLDTMNFVSRNFPLGFSRSLNSKATPRARYEAIAIGSYLALQKRPELATQKIDVSKWLDNPEFAKVTTSDGANVIGRLKARLYFVRDRILGA